MKKRLLSGIKPTGKMHLGNYLGAVSNWVKLQETYDAFYFIADFHALTTIYEDPELLRQDKFSLAVDLLASGIDPKKSCLFVQSDVPEHTELHIIFSMITPLPWLTRVPTYKGAIQELKDKDLNTYGFLGYPVLQAADILLYQADVVPVGKDQLPHLELTREIARRFNHLYQPLFPEPDGKLTNSPVLPGTDGQKMSKSYKNTIPISESSENLQKIIMRMFTDPSRIRRTDPGHPDVCPVYAYQELYNTDARCKEIKADCESAKMGCVDCKKEFFNLLDQSLVDFREKRAHYLANPDHVYAILDDGAKRAKKAAQETMQNVRKAVGL